MARPPGLCARCGGPQRGRTARRSAPVGHCQHCGDPVCQRHIRWDNGWICSKCAREQEKH